MGFDEHEEVSSGKSELLKFNQDRYEALIQNAYDGFVLMDQTGRVIDWNRQACLTFGWTKEEAKGQKVSHLIIPERLRERHERGLAHFIASGHGPVLNKVIEVSALHKDGHEVPIEMTITPLEYNGYFYFGAFLHDISDRKWMNQLFQARLTITDILSKADTVIEGINYSLGAFCRSIGWSYGSYFSINKESNRLKCSFQYNAVGTKLETFCDATELIQFPKGIGIPGQVWQSKASTWIPDVGSLKDFPRLATARQVGLISVFAFPVQTENEFFGVFEFFNSKIKEPDEKLLELAKDIGNHLAQFIKKKQNDEKLQSFYLDLEKLVEKRTRELRLAKETAESASHTKSQFLANMSHEIRTPLSAILGFSELLMNPSLSEEERLDWVQKVHTHGSHLLRVVDEILDLSKVEAGKMTVESVETDLGQLLQTLKPLFLSLVSEKQIAFEYRLLGPVPKKIKTDVTKLRQILINVIGNAIKFTSNGSVTVEIKFEAPHLKFYVQDTGPGITENQAQNLFQPFMQGDMSHTRKFGGTGLGLALSKRFAKALGGNIRLLSTKHSVGTTFEVSIDAGAAVSAELIASLGSEPAHAAHLPKKVSEALKNVNILLAEDSLDNQLLIKKFLQAAGAKVEIAVDGIEAIEKAEKGEFDLVLMDIQMPRKDGYEATTQLRRNGYKQPIIALTAHAMKEERLRSIHAGCDEHLTKPVNRQVLIDTISHFMRFD